MSGGTWVASYVVLWITVLVLAAVVVALLRQIGVLHARLRPIGVHHGNEGPEPGTIAPPLAGVDYSVLPLTLVVFTSPGCLVCKELVPSLRTLDRSYRELQLAEVSLSDATNPVFTAFNVRSTPYVVTVDAASEVRGRGVANTLEQVEVLIEEALARG